MSRGVPSPSAPSLLSLANLFGKYFLRATGARASSARPMMGQRISGVKIKSMSGLPPAANTVPNPLPTLAKMKQPGMMPMKVPIR